MFNSLNKGVGDLTRGIAMSMNPYGTPEAARYAADMVASSGDRLAAAYAAVRNPMNIPAVQAGQASTYF
jgi:chemotaxis regulatin CheY-phosphate phosphatase CheZ